MRVICERREMGMEITALGKDTVAYEHSKSRRKGVGWRKLIDLSSGRLFGLCYHLPPSSLAQKMDALLRRVCEIFYECVSITG